MNLRMIASATKRFGHDVTKALLAEPQLVNLKRHQLAKRLNPAGHYYEWLKLFHEVIRPLRYLEIGIQSGMTLSFKHEESIGIGIDPDFYVSSPLTNVGLHRLTSDEFFSKTDDSSSHPKLDMCFIDGMHEYHQVVRDTLNCARYCHLGSVILLHDVMAPDQKSTNPTRKTQFWPGDVYKTLPFLYRFFPEVRISIIRAAPTGLAVITSPSSLANSPVASTILSGDEQQLAEFDSLTLDEYFRSWLPQFRIFDDVSPSTEIVKKALGNEDSL